MLTIGITGTLGAGKGTVVDYLVKQKGFKHYSVSGYLSGELIKQGRAVNRDGMREIANEIRTKFSPDYIVKILFEKAKKSGENAVIKSIRNPKEAGFIQKHQGILFAVDARQKLRYDRVQSRGSEKDDVSFEEFKNQEKMESEKGNPNSQNLPKCILMADYKFTNNGTIEDLYEKIEKIIGKIS